MTSETFVQRLNCELCQSPETRVLYESDLTEPALLAFLRDYFGSDSFIEFVEGVKFEILQCQACGFIWQKNIPSRVLMEKIYNKWVRADDIMNYQFSASVHHFSSLANESSLIGFLIAKKPMDIRFLDFGMGWGERALSAKAFGYDTYGVEISQKEVEFARSRGIKSFLDSEHINQTFHFINSYGVIDQVLEPVKTVKKLCGMLEKGGIIKISTQNSQWFPEKIKAGKWDRSMLQMLPLFNPNGFTPATLLKLGNLCGLKKIKTRRILKALVPGFYQGSSSLKFMARSLLKHSIGTRTGLEFFFERR